ESAKFLSGGEIPIPIAQGGANAGSITILFKEFGVKLDFTPTVIDSGIINLKVQPEVSTPDYSKAVLVAGMRVAGLHTPGMNTVVELRDGQSLVIGGLTNTDVRKTQRKIPLLGDIPVLGALFKNVRETVDENELVVLVSPHIIRPLEANEVPQLPNPAEAK